MCAVTMRQLTRGDNQVCAVILHKC